MEIKPSQALNLWHVALTDSVRGEAPDLSARQMAILLTVFMVPGSHTVRGLAVELNISKPAVTRALDRLSELGYVRRVRDDTDRRSVLVRRTVRGSVYLSEFADQIAAAAETVET
jgi:DNA-binding MarR family transcriptional regulator